MTTHVALIRGINVGGHKMVAMSDLRDMLIALGFADARSLLQSGNLIFRGSARSVSRLEAMLEAEAAKRLKLTADFLIRTADEMTAVVDANPFPREAARDPARLLVVFLKSAPDAAAVKALRDAITGGEVLEAKGRHAYIVYPEGIGRSRLTGALIEKKLATRGTARNWNTVLKLAALVKPS